MRRLAWSALLVLLAPATAAGQQSVVGYQLGVTQSAGTTIGDIQVAVADDPTLQQGVAVDQDQAVVSQVQGLQLTTTANGNLTLDVATRTLNHALALGVGFAQLVPTLLPRDEDGNVQQGVVADATTTFQANFNYLALIQRPTWGFSLGAGYGFGLNGLLQNGADGRVQGVQAGAQNNVPGQQVGAFSFNGQTHNVNGLLIYQLTPSLRWDFTLQGNYNYTRNGVFTLAAGALGQQNQANAAATNLGAFVPATVHTITPSANLRARVGLRGQFDANALVAYTLAEEVDDSVTITGTTTQVFRAAQPPPATLLNQLTLQYAYNPNDDRSFGIQGIGSLNYRVPTDAQGIELAGAGLSTDTLITTARVFYSDLLPWEVRITIGAGASQAHLFQAPLGAQEDLETFEPIRSNWEPIFDLTLNRRFDPVDVSLLANRTVAVGALGVSAIVTENANLVFNYLADFGEVSPQLTVGFNANRVRGVGRDLFNIPNPNDPAVLAFNNQGFGVNVGLNIPLFESGGLSFDLAATYNFNYVDPDPDGALNLDPLATHTAIGTLRGLYGRGTAQRAAGAGGRSLSDELDAFTADPATGSPLLSNQLMEAGDPLQLGRRVGRPPEPRRDSRQAYQRQIQQQAAEQAAREKAGVVQSVGTVQEEARRAAEEEARRKAEEEKEPPEIPPPWPAPGSTTAPPPPSAPDE